MRTQGLADTVASGDLWVAAPIALLAGFISFASPCVLPLVPGYLGFVGGFADGRGASAGRRRVVLGALLFVLGFTVVFVGLNFAFTAALSLWLLQWQSVVLRVLGLFVIAMGLVFVGQGSFLQNKLAPSWRPAPGLFGAPLLGIVFALGWQPCIGPTLSALFSISATSADPVRAILLGIVYSLGLGIPFVLIAAGFGWAARSASFLRRHLRQVNIIGGVVLIVIGVLMVTGLWQAMLSALLARIPGYVAPV